MFYGHFCAHGRLNGPYILLTLYIYIYIYIYIYVYFGHKIELENLLLQL